jgi:hypothetical protein
LIENAIPSDARLRRLLAFGLASAFVSSLGVLSFQLWSAMIEGMRVGNPDGHMSYRAATPIGERNIAALFLSNFLTGLTYFNGGST